jgi:hypothetical protein
MMKAWLGMSEALKYSEEDLDSLQACKNLIQDIESGLVKTQWDKTLHDAKNGVMAKNEELRWRDAEEIMASKSLRKSAAMRINAPSSKNRCDKAKSHASSGPNPKISLDTELEKVSTPALPGLDSTSPGHFVDKVVENTRANYTAPLPLVGTTCPFEDSYYQGRQLIFKMTYCNGSAATAAARNLEKHFPIQRGDLLWLLDQFLLQNTPMVAGSTARTLQYFPMLYLCGPNCPNSARHPSSPQHPFAEYLHTVAARASDGTYGAMQAVVSLKAALEVLRTNVVKESFVKIPNRSTAQQRRFTTFIINATCPDGLRQD